MNMSSKTVAAFDPLADMRADVEERLKRAKPGRFAEYCEILLNRLDNAQNRLRYVQEQQHLERRIAMLKGEIKRYKAKAMELSALLGLLRDRRATGIATPDNVAEMSMTIPLIAMYEREAATLPATIAQLQASLDDLLNPPNQAEECAQQEAEDA